MKYLTTVEIYVWCNISLRRVVTFTNIKGIVYRI